MRLLNQFDKSSCIFERLSSYFLYCAVGLLITMIIIMMMVIIITLSSSPKFETLQNNQDWYFEFFSSKVKSSNDWKKFFFNFKKVDKQH